MKSKEEIAKGIVEGLKALTNIGTEEVALEATETVEVEAKEEVKEEVKLASELAEGEYELTDGTKFRIDAEGNLVDVVAPTVDEAEGEEAAKDAEDEREGVAMEAQPETVEPTELELAKKKIEELELSLVEATKTPKIKVGAGTPSFEKIDLSTIKDTQGRIAARIINNLKTK